MRQHTPAEIEAITGLTTGNQRVWRNKGLLKRGATTPGGHWRYSDEDALFISVTRALNEDGVDLAVAVAVAGMCLPEIAATLANKSLPVDRPFIFVSRFGDTPADWLHAPADSEVKAEGRVVHAEAAYTALLTRLKDLNLIPEISRAGGRILVPSYIASRVPLAVAALFRGKGD